MGGMATTQGIQQPMAKVSGWDFGTQFDWLKDAVEATLTLSKRANSGVNSSLALGEGHFQGKNEHTVTPSKGFGQGSSLKKPENVAASAGPMRQCLDAGTNNVEPLRGGPFRAECGMNGKACRIDLADRMFQKGPPQGSRNRADLQEPQKGVQCGNANGVPRRDRGRESR